MCALGAACAWEAKTASNAEKKFVHIGAACAKKNLFKLEFKRFAKCESFFFSRIMKVWAMLLDFKLSNK